MNAEIISFENALLLKEKTFIDVRAPAEFEHDHIPGAMNLPVFDDNERKEIGTLYRHAGRDTAIVRGVEIGSGKLSFMIEKLMTIKPSPFIFTCARGGMRSSSVASICSSLGIDSYRLEKGYRGYRSYVTRNLGNPGWIPELYVIHGLAGSGKTEIIRDTENSVDLEKLAGHRSSIFGGIGIEQSNQKRFETNLLERLKNLKKERYILIEGESRKIGNLHLPPALYEKMTGSHKILLETPENIRIDIILKEYASALSDPRVPLIIKSLKTKLGHTVIKELLELYANGNYRKFIQILFEKYYDPLYRHTLNNNNYLFKTAWSGTRETSSNIKKEILRNLK